MTTLLNSLKRPMLRMATGFSRPLLLSSSLSTTAPPFTVLHFKYDKTKLNQQHRHLARSTFKRRNPKGESQKEPAIDNLNISSQDKISLFHNSNYSSSTNTESTTTSTSNHNDWIPPNRPLSGDSSNAQSFIYGNEWEQRVDDQQLKTFIKNESDITGRSVQYFDLDQLDFDSQEWKQLEQQFKQIDSSPSLEDDASWKQIFEEEEKMLQNHKLARNHHHHQEEEDHGWEDIKQEDLENNDDSFVNDPVLRNILSDKQLGEQFDDDIVNVKLQQIGERLKQLQQNKKDQETTRTRINPKENAQHELKPDQDTLFRKETNHDHHLLNQPISAKNKSQGPDWLKTRRDKLRPANMLLPTEAAQRRSVDSSIPVIPHTLLSTREIVSCLESLGGQDVTVIIPDDKTKIALGWEGLIIATGSSYSHIRVMADAIVKNLRVRDLASKQVIGAMYGAEGGDNPGSSSSPRRRKTSGTLNKDDGWLIVDCRNYVVHIQDEVTRKSIDLEALWSPGERGNEGRSMRQVSSLNEAQVDDYVARTPIPDEYTNSLMGLSAEIHGLMSNATLKKQKKNSVGYGAGGGNQKTHNKSRF